MASPAFPEAEHQLPETTPSQADALIARLGERAQAWARAGIPERVTLLRACLRGVLEVADEWVAAACRAKGIPLDAELVGEEVLGGPWATVRNIRLLIEALESGGQPRPPYLQQRGDGQWVARVFPGGLQDRVLYTGFEAEVRMQPGALPTQGAGYRARAAGEYGEGGVALVLGAGNVASIGPMDALYKLFVDDEVVILKMNPVNEYLGPYLERAFAALREAGYFEVVYGGAAIGSYLAYHSGVHSVHMTGSDRTHDAIVWGPSPEEQARRKEAGEPLLTKPITSELGCVTPLFVVPGPWSEGELSYQARHVAAMVANNGSFNCNAAKVLVMPRDWGLRDRFLDKVRDALRSIRARRAYYPGARERYQSFLDRYPQAEVLGQRSEEVVPWTLIPEVPARPGEYALTSEAFCGVLAQIDLPGAEADEFLAAAVPFANEHIWGSLSCMMLVHPATALRHRAAMDRALAELRYGGIGVNVWAGVIYGLVVTTWGAHPGHTLEDIQSGIGTVHNTYLFDAPQKSVVRAPFVIRPTPLWFADHRNLRATASRLLQWEAAPSWRKVPGVVLQALRG